jgi:endonuclease G
MFRALLSAALVLFLNVSLKAQDTVRLSHKEYITVFSKSLKYPVLVEWWVTKNKVQCDKAVPRHDRFVPDPLLASHTDLANDYIKSGFDRGHMAPAADNQCSGLDAMKESFYFSNMAPQTGALNRGDWKTLEMEARDLAKRYDSIKIWAGSYGEQKKVKSLSIPEKCWKVVYIKSTKEWKAYIFNNDQSKADGIANNQVEIKDIEQLTNFKFKID